MVERKLKRFKAKSCHYSLGDRKVDEYLEGYLVGSKSADGKKKFVHIVKDFYDVAHNTNQVIPETIKEIKDGSNKSRSKE